MTKMQNLLMLKARQPNTIMRHKVVGNFQFGTSKIVVVPNLFDTYLNRRPIVNFIH